MRVHLFVEQILIHESQQGSHKCKYFGESTPAVSFQEYGKTDILGSSSGVFPQNQKETANILLVFKNISGEQLGSNGNIEIFLRCPRFSLSSIGVLCGHEIKGYELCLLTSHLSNIPSMHTRNKTQKTLTGSDNDRNCRWNKLKLPQKQEVAKM